MVKCEYCGARIVFGPVRQGEYKFCSEKCRDLRVQTIAMSELPRDLILDMANAVHAGTCPKCGGEGPVDVHTSHRVWSLFAFSSFSSKPEICCARCGRWNKNKAILFNIVFGWWGFPWGFFGTPAQIVRNLQGEKNSNADPSPTLVGMVATDLARRYMNVNSPTPTNAQDES